MGNDIQIEDLGEVSDNKTKRKKSQSLMTGRVMLNRMIINPASLQSLSDDQLLEEAECVSCSFCQADIRKEDLQAHQVSNQCRQLRTPASYLPSLPQVNSSLPEVDHCLPEAIPPPSCSFPGTKKVKCSSLAGKRKRGRPRKERWISSLDFFMSD